MFLLDLTLGVDRLYQGRFQNGSAQNGGGYSETIKKTTMCFSKIGPHSLVRYSVDADWAEIASASDYGGKHRDKLVGIECVELGNYLGFRITWFRVYRFGLVPALLQSLLNGF